MLNKSTNSRNKNRMEKLNDHKNGMVLKRRHIEDTPFYKFQYRFDELPLDPLRPFILEKIRK